MSKKHQPNKTYGFERWDIPAILELNSGGGDNREQYARLLKNLKVAIKEELSPAEREVLEMRYFQGICPSEIAVIRGQSRSTVSRISARAIAKLGKVLKYSF